MRIAEFDTDTRTLIIAEIGNNHEGDIARAENMIHAAAASGADAIKLQIFRTAFFVDPSDTQRYETLRSFELPDEAVSHLARTAQSAGVLFIATPLDLGSAALLEPLVDAFKIASGDITFEPLIRCVAQSSNPIILSTGMATLEEIQCACTWIADERRLPLEDCHVALLHCVSSYPTPDDQANLASIRHLRDHFPLTIGYSDHTLGIDACSYAAAVGARIIEKHFTLDTALSDFRDHQLSADPAAFAKLVSRVRSVESMLGHPALNIQECEMHGRLDYRRSIAANRDLAPGHIFEAGDLMWIRPATGLSPGNEQRLVGRVVTRAIANGERLDETAVEIPAQVAATQPIVT